MKFAVLNPDADTLAPAMSLPAGGHELTVVFGGLAETVAKLHAAAPRATTLDAWEGVLAGNNQAVLVGGAGPAELRFEQLKRLVQEGVPTIVVHPFSLAPLEYYELDMIRQATGAAIVPYEPTRQHSAFAELRTAAARDGNDNASGRIEQIVIERQAERRTREAILTHLVRDVGTARLLGGECHKVSAMGTLPEAAGHGGGDNGQLGVQITTADGALVRWSIGPIVDRAGAKFAITKSGSTQPDAQARVPSTQTIDLSDAATSNAEPPIDMTPIVAALADSNNGLWRDAMRDLEVVDAVERSLRRGRTVELLHEEASEHGTFRGVMAAGGCLFLMLSIATAIAAAVFGKFRFRLANAWPYALLAVLATFLLLQLFKLVFPPERSK